MAGCGDSIQVGFGNLGSGKVVVWATDGPDGLCARKSKQADQGRKGVGQTGPRWALRGKEKKKWRVGRLGVRPERVLKLKK
jgi:hypothetical protein